MPEPERRNHSAHGLRPNSTYVFQVACYNAVGRSQFSVLARATTAAPAPALSGAQPLAVDVLGTADAACGSVQNKRSARGQTVSSFGMARAKARAQVVAMDDFEVVRWQRMDSRLRHVGAQR